MVETGDHREATPQSENGIGKLEHLTTTIYAITGGGQTDEKSTFCRKCGTNPTLHNVMSLFNSDTIARVAKGIQRRFLSLIRHYTVSL